MKHTIKYLPLAIITIFLYSCSKNAQDTANSTGKAGSTAKFAIVDNFLYTVTENGLNIFDIENNQNPILINTLPMRRNVETIFPKDSLLFFGSTTGMLIYDITKPQNPTAIAQLDHFVSCDPVVADGKYAYVTLHSTNNQNSRCNRNTNELQIIDITNIAKPKKIATYNMTKPLGLAIQNDTLYLCDNGLKIYNVANPLKIELIKHFKIKANDIIILEKNLIIVGDDGLYQYKINNNEIKIISKIEICNSNEIY